MGVSKPIFFREISCSSVRERSQQLRPYRVPMNCCISLLFFLVVVAHLSCDQFLDRCWKRSSFVRDEQAGIINCPRPFLRGYGSLRVVHWVRRSWQGPHPVSWSQDQRPYLFLDCWSSMSPSKVHFFSQFLVLRAIPRWWDHDWQFGMCNSSTNRLFPLDIRTQDVRSGLFGDGISISNPWVPSHLYDVNFNDWSFHCFSKKCCMGSGLWVYSRMCVCVFSAYWDGISNTVVRVRNGLVAHTCRYPAPERCVLANPCELNRLGQWFEDLNVFPQNVSRY